MFYYGGGFKRSRDDFTNCRDCHKEIDLDLHDEYDFCGECQNVICLQCGVECVECKKEYEQTGSCSYTEGSKCCEWSCIETCGPCGKAVHRMCKARHTKNCNTLTRSEGVFMAAKLICEEKEKALSKSQAELERLQKRIQDQTEELEIARQDVAEAQARMEAEKAKKPEAAKVDGKNLEV